MPDRCASRCSIVTSSRMSGRSCSSPERAVVERSRTPSSIRLTTATAVNPFVPLAMANCVSTVFGTSYPRWASPYALASSTSSPRSTRTTPEKPLSAAIESTACPSRCIGRQYLPGSSRDWFLREWVVGAHGYQEANPSCQAERSEGAAGGDAEAHDREPPEDDASGASDRGPQGRTTRRPGWACPGGPQPAAALRGRTPERHPGSLEDGQEPADRGDPQGRLAPCPATAVRMTA